jgi:hypothetical protein
MFDYNTNGANHVTLKFDEYMSSGQYFTASASSISLHTHSVPHVRQAHPSPASFRIDAPACRANTCGCKPCRFGVQSSCDGKFNDQMKLKLT